MDPTIPIASQDPPNYWVGTETLIVIPLVIAVIVILALIRRRRIDKS